MRYRVFATATLFIWGLFTLAGCGGGSNNAGSGGNATPGLAISGFSASPNPIPAGSSSTQLTASFTGGTGIITPGNLAVSSGTPVTVNPATPTVYTLMVTPSTGAAITRTLTVSLASGVTVNSAN